MVRPNSPNSDSSDSTSFSDLSSLITTSLRVFSESIARADSAELEMIKAMETRRIEAEKRRVESESEMTQMLLQTQLQIASFLSAKTTIPSRKRKRATEDQEDSSGSKSRDAALMLSLMQFSMLL